MLIFYSTLLEVCGQGTFALLVLPPFFCPNLLMLQEHLVKNHLLRTAVTEFSCCLVTIMIGSEAKKSLSQKVKSFASKMKWCPRGNEASYLMGRAVGWCAVMAAHEPPDFTSKETWWWGCNLHPAKRGPDESQQRLSSGRGEKEAVQQHYLFAIKGIPVGKRMSFILL